MNQSQENKMGTMSVFPLVFRMSLPMMISMIIQGLYNLVDSIFVSMVSENALTAVSLAYPLQCLIIAVGVGTAVGVGALAGRHLGEGKLTDAQTVAKNGLFLAICSGIVFALLGIFAMNLYFGTQTTDPEIFTYGVDYGTICSVFSVGVFVTIVFERMLQITGNTFLSMCIQASGALMNIVLDPIFIFGLFGMPKMGVAGAAVATVVGQWIAMALGLFLCLRKNPQLPLHFDGFRPQARVIGRIYVIAIPAIISQGIGSVMVYAMNLILIGFSSTATAVFGAYFKLMNFAAMPVFGINNAVIAISAYNYGAKKPKRIIQTFLSGWGLATIFMALGCLAFQVFPTQLMGLFNPSEQMMAIGVPALRIMSLSFIPAAYCIIAAALCQGVGQAVYSMASSFTRQLVVLVPAAYLLALSGELGLVWWAVPIAEVASVLCASFFLYRIWSRHLKAM